MPENPSLETLFPKLRRHPYRITSPATTGYNCIAWAAGDDEGVWEPHNYYWPRRISRDGSVRSLVAVFRSLGYAVCDDEDVEAGFEKVAIYGDDEGAYTHAARQLESGVWTSKLGRLEDIEHDSLEALTGSEYGEVLCILKRKLNGR